MKYLSFDDVFLVPQYSECTTRSDINTSCSLGSLSLDVPIMSSNMDTITESEMAITMQKAGGIGAIHRFMDIDRAIREYEKVKEAGCDSFVSIGVGHRDIGRAEKLYGAGARYFIVDIAHGHSSLMKHTLKVLRNTFGTEIYIVGGNIATEDAVRDMAGWGADAVKIGIGGGSCCSTRIVTGHGVPMFTCISKCSSVADELGLFSIADGGIRSSGDIAKAIAAGADMVMLGSLLSGTASTPGDIVYRDGQKYKSFRGMASSDAMNARYNNKRQNLPTDEGVSGLVPFNGLTSDIIKSLRKGLQSGMSYTGAQTIKDFQLLVKWETQTHGGYLEGKPRVKNV